MKLKKYAAVVLALTVGVGCLFGGCGFMNKDAKLIDINDGKDSITLGYGNFVAKYNQALYDQTYRSVYGDDMWSQDLSGQGNTFEEDVKDSALEQIEVQYLSKLHAKDYKVSLTSTDKKKIKSAVTSFMSGNDKDAIKQMGATKEYVQQMLTLETYSYRVQKAIEAQVDTSVTDNEAAQTTFSYTLFSTNSSEKDADGNAIVLSTGDIAAIKAKADAVAASSDFDAEVTNQGGKVESYSFTTSEAAGDDTSFDASVIEVAKKLSDGQVSDVITVDGEGYYVLRMDKTYDADATATKKTELAKQKGTDYYQSVVDGWKKDITWTVDKKVWKKVTFDDLFESVKTTDSSKTTAK